jgi:hypothetical protein
MKTNRMTLSLAALALAAATSFGAHAATVTFVDLASGDGLPSLFDPGASIVAGNTLQVGLNNFSAPTFIGPGAVDSFAVRILAAPGHYITTLDYSEIYDYAVTVGGVVGITLTAVANSLPSVPAFAFFGGNASGSNVEIAISQIVFGPGVTEVLFNISNTLVAFAPGGSASITKTLATLEIGTTPIPLPPAIGLLGAALIGLANVRPRRQRA